MRIPFLLSSVLAVLVTSGCTPGDDCTVDCGNCGFAGEVTGDTASPLRAGLDSAHVPVVELVVDKAGTCYGSGALYWMRWSDGAPSASKPGSDLDGSASLETIQIGQDSVSAIHWKTIDLEMHYDATAPAFRFKVIEGGVDKGAFQCVPDDQEGLACGPQ